MGRDIATGNMLKWCMMNSTQHPETERDRQQLRDAEQQLCSEALQSTSYDHMTDKEWIALCEQVAVQARDEKVKPHTAPHDPEG
jgi:hypothetical protein